MSRRDLIDDDISFRSLTTTEQKSLSSLRRAYSENYRQVNKGQWAIIGIMALEIILGIILTVTDSISDSILVMAIVILVFAIALVLTFSRPVTGLIIATVLYSLLIIVSLIDEPERISKGILFKMIIFYFLFNGISHALKNVQILKSIKELGGEAPDHGLI